MLSWTREGDEANYRPVPSWALSRRPVSGWTMMVVRTLAWIRVAAAIVAGLARPLVSVCLAGQAARSMDRAGRSDTVAVPRRSTCC